jgi:hypothetical protein
MAEVKDTEPNLNSKYDLKNIENRQIIDAEPIANVATTTIHLEEPIDLEEGEHLFHS